MGKQNGDDHVDQLVDSVNTGLETRQLSEAISQISQEMRTNNPQEWAQIASRMNKGLDAANSNFGSIDIVGVEDGNLVVERADHSRVYLDENAKVTRVEAAQVPGGAPNIDGVTVRKSPEGALVQSVQQGDGEEHPTVIVHIDGTRTDYGYDMFGGVNRVTETDARGNKFSEYENSNDNWHKVIGPPNLPENIHGVLDVDQSGTHTFKDLDNGSTLTRTADGSLQIVSAEGTMLFQNRAVRQNQGGAAPDYSEGASNVSIVPNNFSDGSHSTSQVKNDAVAQGPNHANTTQQHKGWFDSVKEKWHNFVDNLPPTDVMQRNLIKTALWSDPNTAISLLQADPSLLNGHGNDDALLAHERLTVKTNIYANPDFAIQQLRSFPQLLD